MNLKRAEQTLQKLAEQGVQTICICPGGRNAPFVKLLSSDHPFELFSFYDERSAGFFAIGRSRRDNRPVAIITTSGTAVSELHSSVIEAFYSNTPIVVVSADRPRRLRGSGAPQSIDQTNIFGEHVNEVFDLEKNDHLDFQLDPEKPTHINICFDEPLIDDELELPPLEIAAPIFLDKDFPLPQKSFCKPLLVVGALKEHQREPVAAALKQWSGPIYAESLSGLRDHGELVEKLICGGEHFVSKLVKSGAFESIIRIGDVPVGRYWRDLDQLRIPVTVVSDKEFGGLERAEVFASDLQDLDLAVFQFDPWSWGEVVKQSQVTAKKQIDLFEQHPSAETSLIAQLAAKIPKEDRIYLGNSLAVRQWDLVASGHKDVWASRGVNGIDGQISTGLGLKGKDQNLWIIIGDLTALYDFSGMWPSLRLNEENINLVVINNGGGRIFSCLFDEALFLNEHDLNFQSFATQWGWNFLQVESLSDLTVPNGKNLIEIKTDQAASQSFWQEYDKL